MCRAPPHRDAGAQRLSPQLGEHRLSPVGDGLHGRLSRFIDDDDAKLWIRHLGKLPAEGCNRFGSEAAVPPDMSRLLDPEDERGIQLRHEARGNKLVGKVTEQLATLIGISRQSIQDK